jgi:hypothetical protein
MRTRTQRPTYGSWRHSSRTSLDGHHGDHAASYLTEGAQFHAGTVGNFAGRTTVAGVLAGIVAAIPDLHANVQDRPASSHRTAAVFPLAESAAPSGPGSRFGSYRACMSSYSLPAAASRCPVVDGAPFDPLGAQECRDPMPWLRAAQHYAPVFFMPPHRRVSGCGRRGRCDRARRAAA